MADMDKPPTPLGWNPANWDRYWNGLTPEQKALWAQGQADTGTNRRSVGPVIPTSQPGAVPLTQGGGGFNPGGPFKSAKTVPNQPEQGGGGAWGGVKDFFGNYGDDILKYGTAAAKGYGAYKDQQRSDRDEARRGRFEQMAIEEYARRAPLRDKALQMLMQDHNPDTSDLKDPNDPAGRYRPVRVGSVL